MTKLLSTYRAAPTAANRLRLQNCLTRHMMALCIATVEEIEFLKANGFHV